jgi:hypothetical protein
MMKEMWMRFMMVVIRKGYETAAADAAPGRGGGGQDDGVQQEPAESGRAARARWAPPPSTGALVSHVDGKATVTEIPFAEAKEAIGGYWIIQVPSREEALEWARRAPMANNEIIEVRQIYERADFSIVVQKEAVQKAAEGFEELSNAAAATA